MSDNSPRATRRRLQEGVLEEVYFDLNRIEVEAREVKDFHALQVVGRVRDACGRIGHRIDEDFEADPETNE